MPFEAPVDAPCAMHQIIMDICERKKIENGVGAVAKTLWHNLEPKLTILGCALAGVGKKESRIFLAEKQKRKYHE